MNVIWSQDAEDTFVQIFENLVFKWNIDIALQFEIETNQLINNVGLYNHICPKSKIKNYHKCILTNTFR